MRVTRDDFWDYTLREIDLLGKEQSRRSEKEEILADLRAGIAVSALINIQLGKDSTPFGPADFYPRLAPYLNTRLQQTEPQLVLPSSTAVLEGDELEAAIKQRRALGEQLKMKLSGAFSMFGGKWIEHKNEDDS